jgi:hypothetical protein
MAFGDNGARYDEACETCRKVTEVCNDCGSCKRHCSCEQDAADQKEIADFQRAYPGFLEQVEKHREQGAQEHD